MANTMSGEHLSLENPLTTQGDLPKITSEHTILPQSPSTNISLELEDHIPGSQSIEHQCSLIDVVTSSNIVLDTVLTTQNLHFDIEDCMLGQTLMAKSQT